MSRSNVFCILGFLGVVSCRDAAPPTAPVERPDLSIVDAVHNGGPSGFYFLPPMVKAPAYSGAFDATRSPRVEICALSGTSCDGTIASFSTTSGTGSEVVRVDPAAELYILNWHTDRFALSPEAVYRVTVSVDGQELGHADVQVFTSAKAAKNAATDEIITLVDGRTLPIKFRVEGTPVTVLQPGVPLTVSPSTETQMLATPATAGGSARLEIPGETLLEPINVSASPALLAPGVAGSVITGSAYELGPDGTQFASPLSLSITYDPSSIPANVSEGSLRLVTLRDGIWFPVPGGWVDPATNTVSGEIAHFSTYAVAQLVSVESGFGSACGIGTDGVPYCWSASEDVIAAQPFATSHQYSSMSLGALTCGVATGSIYCTGLDSIPLTWGNAPVLMDAPLSGGAQMATVSSGWEHICGASSTSRIFCRGGNSWGQMGAPPAVGSIALVEVLPPGGPAFTSVTTGFFHSCALNKKGAAFCWGSNSQGQLGTGTTVDATTPTAVASPSKQTFTSIDGGYSHTCALTGLGSIYCWGDGAAGQLGNGSTSSSSVPVLVTPPVPVVFQSVTAGTFYSCGVATGGDVWCWGENYDGQLGNGVGPNLTSFSTPTPIPVRVQNPAGIAFQSVSAGYAHTCAVTATTSVSPNTVYCWGRIGSTSYDSGRVIYSTPSVVSWIVGP